MSKIINLNRNPRDGYRIIRSTENLEQWGDMCDEYFEKNTNQNKQNELKADKHDIPGNRHKTKKFNRLFSWPITKYSKISTDMNPVKIYDSDHVLRSNKFCRSLSQPKSVSNLKEEKRLITNDRSITSICTPSTDDMHACPLEMSCCCTKKKWLISILAVCVVLIITVSISVKTTERNQLTQSSSLTIEQQSEICLLHHIPVTYSQTSNPLGDKCRNGSNYVQQLCRKDASHHNCNECPDGELLPTVCFCDVGHQCPNAADAPRKHTCYDCQKHCPCLNNGTCSCTGQQLTGEDLVCSCPAGYGGRYCEIVRVRICKKETRETIQIEHCETSMTDDCYIYSQITKSNLTCTIVKDFTGWKDFLNCSHPYT